MKWLMDSSAINRVATESRNYNVVFTFLTDLVAKAELTFCDQVIAELDRTAEGDPGPLWATTVKDRRVDKGASYSTQRWVLRNVTDIVDEDDPYDAAPYVVAQARSLQDQGKNGVTIVSEDITDKPTRKSIRSVCGDLSIPCVGVPEMMQACGHPWP